MIQWVYRYFCGYLDICLRGNNVRRFFNLCTRNGICFNNIRYNNQEEYFCEILWKDIRRIVPHLRKTKTRIRILHKRGYPYFLILYRNRLFWFVGIIIVIFSLYVLSGEIWKIDIKGNKSISNEEIIRFLEKENVCFGTKKKNIVCADICESIRKQFDNVSWSSVYVDGTKLTVEIEEGLKKKEISKGSSYNDLVASKDAVIESVITRSGVPKVRKGDTVKAGDILVEAEYPIIDDSEQISNYIYCDADADILGYVTYDYDFDIPCKQIKKTKTGRTKQSWSVQLFGHKISTPILGAKYNKYDCIEKIHQIKINSNFYLPFFYGESSIEEIKDKTISLGKKQVNKLAEKMFLRYIDDLKEKGVLIISKNLIIEQKEDKYHVKGVVYACEDITMASPAIMHDISHSQEEQGN